MTPPDPNHPDSVKGLTQPMIKDGRPSDGSATDGHGLPAMIGSGWQGGPPPTPEILQNPMDHIWLLHSFRRRWVIAVGFGLLVWIAVSALVWYLTPPLSSAQVLLRVFSKKPSVLKSIDEGMESNFEMVQTTQVTLIKSHFVLAAALRQNPLIRQTATLRDEKNQVAWLQNHLVATFLGEGEILAISLAEQENPNELVDIVEAVTDAYLEEVVYKDRAARSAVKAILVQQHQLMTEAIRTKEAAYLKLSRDLQTSDSSQYSLEREMAFNELWALRREQNRIENLLAQTQLNQMILRQQMNSPLFLESRAEQLIAQSLTVQTLMQDLEALSLEIVQTASQVSGSSPVLIRMTRQKVNLSNQLNQTRRELKRQYIAELENTPNTEYMMAINTRKMELSYLRLRNEELKIAVTTLEERLKTLGEQSAELNIQKAKLVQLQLLAQEMGSKIEAWNVEEKSPDRIQKLQQAIPRPGIDGVGRYILVIIAGMFGFGLTGFVVAFVEFQAKRLNGPYQIDKGLGIRVVGTLPSLSFRSSDDGTDPVLAMLMESIDSIRTTLMHDSSTTAKERRVVLVTSATGHEGRTTVASQLAASLARAGRRTVLVDGDLRNPSLHTLFDVPLEDGFCEVLRTEADVTDVIRPTHAEGLWLLTAGYCNINAVQALAKDQVQPIFDHLRDNYDFVIIDGAPVLDLSDAMIMGQYADGVVLSVLRDVSQVPRVYEACELLRSIGIHILGSVVNGVRGKPSERTSRLRLVAAASDTH